MKNVLILWLGIAIGTSSYHFLTPVEAKKAKQESFTVEYHDDCYIDHGGQGSKLISVKDLKEKL